MLPTQATKAEWNQSCEIIDQLQGSILWSSKQSEYEIRHGDGTDKLDDFEIHTWRFGLLSVINKLWDKPWAGRDDCATAEDVSVSTPDNPSELHYSLLP